MATEKAKPDGLLVIKPNRVKPFLEPLDIEDLPGIGQKTAEKLRVIGVDKIKELKKLSKSKTLKTPCRDLEILKKEAKKLLLKILVENPRLIRLVGLRISSLEMAGDN